MKSYTKMIQGVILAVISAYGGLVLEANQILPPNFGLAIWIFGLVIIAISFNRWVSDCPR